MLSWETLRNKDQSPGRRAQRLDACVHCPEVAPIISPKALGLLVSELLISQLMFKNRAAFSIIELMIVVAIIGILSAILIPAVGRYHLSARQKTCVSNLRQIDQAIQQWAVESRALSTDRVTHSNVALYLKFLPACPSPTTNGGTFFSDYGMTFVNDDPFCVANSGLAGSPHLFVVPATNSSGLVETPSPSVTPPN